MLCGAEKFVAEVVVEPVALANTPGALLGPLSRQPGPAVLDSSAFDETLGRYSILACRPLDVLTLRAGVLRDSRRRVLARRGDDEALWAALAGAFSAVRVGQWGQSPVSGGQCPPYVPGWIGYVGYEVGRHVERLPCRAVRDTALPDLRLAFHDALLVYDAAEGTWQLVTLRFAGAAPSGAGAGAAALRRLAERAADLPPEPLPAPAAAADAAARAAPRGARSNFTPADYRRAVARCVEYIAAGDIFQVNLSQRFVLDRCPPPLDIYRALRRRNPASHAAMLAFRSAGQPCAVLSSSPELFLRVRPAGPDPSSDGGTADNDRLFPAFSVLTRPIKGTRRRTGRPADDAAAAADLLASPKDNAELAMIIDLLRNDLGRVCRFGTIRVTEPRRLETHPTVLHLVGTVAGVLRAGVGPAEMLRATFPGGSITGAPKIRAMEIIDELEGVARGVYTGCIGIVGADGSSEWNIAIRTIVCDGGRALVQAGGGIVADSDPAAEHLETLDKARALLEAIAEAGGPRR